MARYRSDNRRRTIGVVAGCIALLLSAACSGAGSASGGNSTTFVTDSPGGWGLTWSYNTFDPHFLGPLYSYAFLPLAIAKPTTIGDDIPELATSWSVDGSTITIHLRQNAKWQDGTAFTSRDVLTTLLLQGTNGNQIWGQVTDVRTPDAHMFVLDLQKNVPAHIVLSNVLGISPVP